MVLLRDFVLMRLRLSLKLHLFQNSWLRLASNQCAFKSCRIDSKARRYHGSNINACVESVTYSCTSTPSRSDLKLYTPRLTSRSRACCYGSDHPCDDPLRSSTILRQIGLRKVTARLGGCVLRRWHYAIGSTIRNDRLAVSFRSWSPYMGYST